MISIYLNSLNNMLGRDNPMLSLGPQFFKSLRAFWNMPGNMGRIKNKLNYMEERLHAIEVEVDTPFTGNRGRFDVYR